MISIEEHKEYRNSDPPNKCFRCHNNIWSKDSFYTIEKAVPTTTGIFHVSVDFHIACFIEIAGETYLFEHEYPNSL